MNNTVTPFERPQELAGKEFLTDAELVVIKQRAAACSMLTVTTHRAMRCFWRFLATRTNTSRLGPMAATQPILAG